MPTAQEKAFDVRVGQEFVSLLMQHPLARFQRDGVVCHFERTFDVLLDHLHDSALRCQPLQRREDIKCSVARHLEHALRP
jgi:hypothetical protein